MKIDLEILTLSEVSQKEKDKYHMILHITYLESRVWHKLTHLQKINKLIEMENGPVVAKGEQDRLGVWGWG